MPPFPVSDSTLSAEALASWLSTRYDWPVPVSCRLFRRGMNHVYQVQAASERYILRIYTHGWRTREEVEAELGWMQKLAPTGVVPLVIADRAGHTLQTLEAPEGIRYAVVFSFAPGHKHAHFSREASYQIGVALGKVHQLAESQTLQRVDYTPKIMLVEAMKGIREFHKQPSESLDFLDKLAHWLLAQYPMPTAARRGAVHLDVWFDNLHFTPEGAVTILDFDFCGNGPLIYDVSYFLYQLLATHLDTEQYEDKAKAFIAGYEAQCTLSAEEKAWLPKACLAVMLYFFHMQCATFDTFSNVFMNQDHLDRYVRSLRRWMGYQGLVLE